MSDSPPQTKRPCPTARPHAWRCEGIGRCLVLVISLGVCVSSLAAPIPRDVTVEAPLEPTAARLLYHKIVRKELKLSVPQVTAVVAEMRRLEEARVRRLAAIGGQVPDDPQPLRRLAEEHERALTRAAQELAHKLLDGPQRQRLAQIDRRLRGPLAFRDSAVMAALQLGPHQRQAIITAVNAYASEEDRYLSGAVDGDDTKLREELLTLRQDTLSEIERLLTPPQRDAWQKLLGPAVAAFDPTDFHLLRSIRSPGP